MPDHFGNVEGNMKFAFALIVGCMTTMAGAQIRSVTDPSAFRPDRPKSNAPDAKTSPEQETKTIANGASPAVEPAAPMSSWPVSPAQPATSPTVALNLVCGGGGTANKVGFSTYQGSSNASGLVGTDLVSLHGSSSGTITTQRQQGFADQVDVRLFSGDDRIRMPRTMLPLIRGGSEGWFKLKDVKVTDRAITASAAVNFLNNPKVHIDRLTGTISIDGKAGSYSGQCEAVDPNAQRKF